MSKKTVLAVLVGAAVVVIGAVTWFALSGGEAGKPDEQTVLRSRTIAEKQRKQPKKTAAKRPRKSGEKVAIKLAEKPNFLDDIKAEEKLTDEMRKIFLELQSALDLDDRKKVYALVHKLQLMDEWPDGIPKSVKLKALQALSWFGAEGMAEAIGFLADSDAEIRETAVEQFERMFSDSWGLGDIKLAETMVQAVKVISDTDALDSFYDQFSNMRDTVKAETALKILKGENKAASDTLKDRLGELFDSADYEVKTTEDVEKFLKDAEQVYKDHPEKVKEDDEMYGPTDWNW